MTLNSISHTQQHWYLQIALQKHGELFAALDQEMSNFVPKKAEDFSALRDELWKTVRPINEHLTDEEFRKFVEGEVVIHLDPEIQFRQEFSERYMMATLPIIFLSHALLEATINAVLAIGLHQAGKIGDFAQLEKQEVKTKWADAPKEFLPEYVLIKGDILYGRLAKLTKMRNAWVHSKITLRIDNVKVEKGTTENGIEMTPSGRKLIASFVSLPHALHKNLCDQISDLQLKFHLASLLRRK